MVQKPLLQFKGYELKNSRRHIILRATFTVDQPGIVAIVGPPKAGKTLLLQSIIGDLPRGVHESGNLMTRSFELSLRQPVKSNPSMPRGSVFRFLAQGFSDENDAEKAIQHALKHLHVWDDFQARLMQPIRSLTLGDQLILSVCRRVILKEPILLLDEPLNHLPLKDVERLSRAVLRVAETIPVLWASETLRSVSPIATRVIMMHEGEIVADHPSDHIVVNPGTQGEKVLNEVAHQSVAAVGLDELYHELLTMGSLAERAVHQAVQSLTDQNLSVARDVLNHDTNIDRRERLIVDRALGLLGRTAPVGKNLRILVTVIKVASDLQRIADHAVNISEVTLAIGEDPLIKPLMDIPRMAEKAQMMVRYSLDALIRRDEALAREVLVHDGPIHALYRELFEELLGFITDGGDAYRAGQALYLLFVARYLERVAEHATNIALHVIFMVTGERAHRETPPDDDLLPHPFMPG